MRRLILIVLILPVFFVTPLFAQKSSDTTRYALKLKSAQETKRAGATLTILGGAALVAGMIIVNSSLEAGAGIGTAGLVATSIGIPIWIVGGVNYRKYSKKTKALTVRLNADLHQQGLCLSYRF